MKVKLDENLMRSAQAVLLAAGHEVDTVIANSLAQRGLLRVRRPD